MGLLTGSLSPLHSLSRTGAQREGEKVRLKSYVDSGAARSVCPIGFGAQFGLHPTASAQSKEGFQTATGKVVTSQGGRVVEGTSASGKPISMSYSVANIGVALDSVSQICDSGASVHFHRDGGWIQSRNGETTHFERDGDTYVRTVWVEREPAKISDAPLTRQGAIP